MRFNPFVSYFPTFLEPDIRIGGAALHSWQHNQLANPRALQEWAKETLTDGSWRDVVVSALNVSISFCSGTPREIDRCWFVVHTSHSHDLLGRMRAPRNDRPRNGCGRVFPSNED